MNNLTYDNVFNSYLDYLSLKYKPTTIRSIEQHLKKHFLPVFKDVIIFDNIDDKYQNWLIVMKNLGNSTCFYNHLYTYTNSLFKYLYKFYNIQNIVEKYGHIKSFKVETKKNVEVWSMKEFRKFIKKVDDKTYHALFSCLFFTGIRKGEALALKFKNFKKKYIFIETSITKDKFNGKRLEQTPKTKKSIRKIRIDFKLRHELKKLRKYYIKNFEDFNENFYIFGGKEPLATTTVERKKNNYCNLAGVKHITIHGFRHSHATLLFSKGVSIKYIQERLGHADVSTTLTTYVHIDVKAEKKALRMLNFQRIKF